VIIFDSSENLCIYYFEKQILDMLSPTRSSTQTILKAVVTTASAMLQESPSTSVEQKEESNDGDDTEPVKKKFKDDTETEVNIEICFAFYIDMV
jgi:hypothetical protein